MENYVNYFTEIEEHFQKRRGQAQPLSPLDWSLIESLRDAGVPLIVVLRGVDRAFEKHARRKRQAGRVNSLSYCTQAILAEHERHQESVLGREQIPRLKGDRETEDDRSVIELLGKACQQLEVLLTTPKVAGLLVLKKSVRGVLSSLNQILGEVVASKLIDYETLELRLNTLEEKILAAVISEMHEEIILEIQTEIKQDIGQHRRGLTADHIAMLEKKMMRKKLLESIGIPRLSLFYLPLN